MPPTALGLNADVASSWQAAVETYWPSEPLVAMALAQHSELGLLALILTDQRVLVYDVNPDTGLPARTTYAVFLQDRTARVKLWQRTVTMNGHEFTLKDEQSAATAANLLADLVGVHVQPGEPSALPKMTARLPRAAKAIGARPVDSSAKPRRKLFAGLAAAAIAVAVAVGIYVVNEPDSSTADLADSSTPQKTPAAARTSTHFPTTPSRRTPTQTESSEASTEFLSRITDVDIFLDGSEKLKIGKVLCSSLERGDSTRSVVIQMQNADYLPDEVGRYLSTATSALCPSFYSSVEADLRTFPPGN